MSTKQFDSPPELLVPHVNDYDDEGENDQGSENASYKHVPVSFRTVFCYGVGHFLNDMTAACWFNYLLVFLIQVAHQNSWAAGMIMLSGQIADAIATPIVGILSDRTKSRFGRRKLWLAGGAVIVNISFFFVFSDCYPCAWFNVDTDSWFYVVYWAFLASLFNVGWAALQVAHMALVPEISHDEGERVQLNSARYAGGIAATLLVLGIALAAFGQYGVSMTAFQIISISSIVIGDFFTLVFLFGVKEETPSFLHSLYINRLTESERHLRDSRSEWYSWFKVPMFYQVALIYMFSRIAVNMSQIFMPFFLQFSLKLLKKRSTIIAEVPLVIMGTSFAVTFFLRRINKLVGRQITYLVGGVFTLGGLAGIYFLDLEMWYLIYVYSFLLGIGTTTILVTSVSMEADLVGIAVQSGAFVFGALSFTDKLSNGILIQITSQFSENGDIVRNVIVWIPAIACLLSILVTFTIVEYYRKRPISEETKPLLVSEETKSLLDTPD